MVKGQEEKIHQEQLELLGLFNFQKRRLHHGFYKGGAEGQCLSLISGDSNRTRGNVMELHQGRVRLGARKRFFTKMMVGTRTDSPKKWS